jgi:hypothetical protein
LHCWGRLLHWPSPVFFLPIAIHEIQLKTGRGSFFSDVLQMGEAEGGAEVFAQVEAMLFGEERPGLFGDGGKGFDNPGIELHARTSANLSSATAN